MSKEYYDNYYKSLKLSGVWDRPWNKGKEMDPEYKKKWIKIMKKKTWKPHSEETIAGMRRRMVDKLKFTKRFSSSI